MSSNPGGSDGGGDNEDVEADESTRTEDARQGDELEEKARSEDAQDEEFGDMVDGHANEQDDGEELLDDEGPDEAQGGQMFEEEDYPQLEREMLDSHPEDIGLEVGPSSPAAQSPAESLGGTGSNPDDTPSLQGSLISSLGRVASPTRRKQVSRTPSGALQPFERRFESRLSASPSGSPRAGSPAFLSAHSRQVSLSSQISQISSHDGTESEDTAQAPWDVIKWTKLRKITGQAFSEMGRRNFGRPTCMAVSALIAVGTSKGLVLGFDYHQTLKVIIGQGTKATECGSVTALAIAADYSTIATGHANGHIFTWEINRPARPFLQIPPLERGMLQQAQHPDGHLLGCAILHLGFLGTRHTAVVSANAGGMAFSHIASRGLGPVIRTVKSTRLLGRYPPADSAVERSRKPSSVLAFSALPLGNVEQATDGMGLTAMLTPYLLVIVSTTPIAQTQHKSPRPKEIKPHGTLSGCLAWFPAVKLKATAAKAKNDTSDTKLVYCWANVLTVLEVKAIKDSDPAKPPSLEFHPRSRWRAEEAIVAVQWLGRSVLGVLTISQRLLIVEDGSLQVTDSVDLMHRHIYHQDTFSQQLHSVVERLDSEDPSLHGVVADAFYMSFKAHKGRTFLLGFDDLTVGTLSNWADRLMALMEAGDHIAAINLATEYYAGGANNVTVGLPDVDDVRHEMVKERLVAMISASLAYTFAQRNAGRDTRLRELADVCFDASLTMRETDYLFSDVFDMFENADEEDVFISVLEPYVLDGDVKTLPPEVIKTMVAHFISENQAARLEELLCRLEPLSFDLDSITMLCRQHSLYDALIYIWTRAMGDYVTPLVDLLSLVKLLNDGVDEDVTANPFYDSAMKVYSFLAYSLTGRRYPSGEFVNDSEAMQSKSDLYEYLFAGRAAAWPQGSDKVFHIVDDVQEEPAFPYLVLLLEFDTASLMSMLNEAFEDSFLNEVDEDQTNSLHQANGANGRLGYKMTRDHILSILLDVMRQKSFEPEQIVFLDMFIARSLPKYPGQLVLPGSLVSQILQRLCHPPSEVMRDDCQLSVEYLLSAYHPPDVDAVVKALTAARFYRVLKTVFRSQRILMELLKTYLEDPTDKDGIFDCITFCLRNSTGTNQKQLPAVKRTILDHIDEIANINPVLLARTLGVQARDLLQRAVNAMSDTYQKFVFLRTLLEPPLLREDTIQPSLSPLPLQDQKPFIEHYIQLMCAHDPRHVADYIDMLPTSDLHLSAVLPAMERTGVVDAAVVLLARDGLARDAMERLVKHLRSLTRTLRSLIEAVARSPDPEATRESAEGLVGDVEKYSKVGIWLCRGQTATAERRLRPRTNPRWEVKEEALDLDEWLWLELVDTVVRICRDVGVAFKELGESSTGEEGELEFAGIVTMLRTNVQGVFTALLAATSTSTPAPTTGPKRQPPAKPTINQSFPLILRAFLTRSSSSSSTSSLADLRAVLCDIFSAYTFEAGVLSLAKELLGGDTFVAMEDAMAKRQRGWRPRTQVCESCKRRAWGAGIGGRAWEEFVGKEKERRMRTDGVGDDGRRAEGKGKGKGRAGPAAKVEQECDGESAGKIEALVVFACRHVFHRSCLRLQPGDGERGEGRGGGGAGDEDRTTRDRQEVYKCPLCSVDSKKEEVEGGRE